MNITIREPGSALTHFIAMLLALCAAVPLLVRAAVHSGVKSLTAMTVFMHGFIVCRQHDIPFCQLLRARSAHLSENGSYDDFHPDRRDLYAGMPADPAKALRSDAACRSLGNRAGRNFYQRLLDHLSKMVFLCFVYRNGLELPVRSGTAVFPASASRLFMAARRRTDLYCRRHYLRAQAAAV